MNVAPPAAPAGRRWHSGTLSYGAAGLVLLFLFLLLGDFAWSLRERAVQEVFKAMLLNLSKNALLLNVLAGALPAAVTMVVAPAVGAWSDRTRTRLGRRIPFLLVSAPIVGASLIGLAYSDALGAALADAFGLGAQQRVTATLACMVLFWTIFEVAAIVGNELYYALINDTVPHALIGRFYGTFRIVSLGVGAGFFAVVFNNQLLEVVRPVLMGIGAIYMGGFFLMCWRVREGSYPPPAPHAPAPAHTGRLGAYAREVTAVPFFLLLFGVIALAKVSYLIMNTNSMNASLQFGVDRNHYAHATTVTYLFSIALSYPLGWLIDRMHPTRVGLGVIALYAAAMLAGWIAVRDVDSFMFFFIVHGVLAGAIFTTTTALLPRLLPRGRYAQLATVSAALTALATVLFTPVTGALIDMIGGDFRLAFLMAGLVGLAGVGLWLLMLLRFERMGGRKAYVAPDAVTRQAQP